MGVAQRAGRGSGGAAATEAKPPEGLIPVTDPLVVQKCSSCHAADAKGNLTRISAVRTTPEGWEEAIKRMVRLNGLQLTPDEARRILRYLSDTHGLAPEEAAKVEYFAEHRLIDEDFPDADTRRGCASCHAIAKPLSWRRTPEDWDLLKNMHLAFFPSIQASFGAGGGGGGGGGAAAAPAGGAAGGATPPKPAVDVALAYIKKSAPLETPEWAAWSPDVMAPKLSGTWTLTGYMPGKGKFYRSHQGDRFCHGLHHAYGHQLYQWAARSTAWTARRSSTPAMRGAAGHEGPLQRSKASTIPNGLREVMMISKDQTSITGRWFWGTYEEFGMDVTLHRDTVAPAVLGTDVSSLKAGSVNAPVTIYGSHLADNADASRTSIFGKGVTVTKVVSATPEDGDADCQRGCRGDRPDRVLISVAGVTVPGAYAVYEKIDYPQGHANYRDRAPRQRAAREGLHAV